MSRIKHEAIEEKKVISHKDMNEIRLNFFPAESGFFSHPKKRHNPERRKEKKKQEVAAREAAHKAADKKIEKINNKYKATAADKMFLENGDAVGMWTKARKKLKGEEADKELPACDKHGRPVLPKNYANMSTQDQKKWYNWIYKAKRKYKERKKYFEKHQKKLHETYKNIKGRKRLVTNLKKKIKSGLLPEVCLDDLITKIKEPKKAPPKVAELEAEIWRLVKNVCASVNLSTAGEEGINVYASNLWAKKHDGQGIIVRYIGAFEVDAPTNPSGEVNVEYTFHKMGLNGSYSGGVDPCLSTGKSFELIQAKISELFKLFPPDHNVTTLTKEYEKIISKLPTSTSKITHRKTIVPTEPDENPLRPLFKKAIELLLPKLEDMLHIKHAPGIVELFPK